MKNYLLYCTIILCAAACSNQPGKNNAQAPLSDTLQVVAKKTVKKESPKNITMSDETLMNYFTRSSMQDYTNCHSEKGQTQDFYDGKRIPIELAIQYKLYKASMSPSIAMKHKKDAETVSYRGIQLMEINEKLVFIYGIGINMEGDAIPDVELVEIRALVLSRDGAIESNYFVGGFTKKKDQEEKFVCRKLSYKNGKLVLEINPTSFNVPSTLRLKDVEERDI